MSNLISKKTLLGLIVILVVGFAASRVWANENPSKKDVNKAVSSSAGSTSKPAVKYNPCASNAEDKAVIVSISKQHLWGCESTTSVYDSAVITGMESYPADLTPVGTYKIYGKQTDQTLRGSDNTGSWSDPVSYWEPFLDNQYGAYGFHDATWRNNADFGKVDINAPFTTTAKSASHGCVELPLAAAKWLYNWSVVGTTVTIVS